MQFRYARHTNNLDALADFYINIIGLDKLGGFTNHQGYDGVFLGIANQDWHIEFTQSDTSAQHTPDRDDLIVLYLQDVQKMQKIVERVKSAGIEFHTSQNPYWNEHGIELTDPDGFGVMLTVKTFG